MQHTLCHRHVWEEEGVQSRRCHQLVNCNLLNHSGPPFAGNDSVKLIKPAAMLSAEASALTIRHH